MSQRNLERKNVDDTMWIIVHSEMTLFFRLPKHDPASELFSATWTWRLVKAQFFSSEAAAVAVIEEWGLQKEADARTVCPLEKNDKTSPPA